MNPNPERKTLTWRLRVVMAQRDVKSATDLHRRLRKYGLDISSAQLSRMMYTRPKRVNTELLDALINVLQCQVNDLLVSEQEGQKTEAEPSPESSTKKKPRKGSPVIPENVVGPKVTPFPRPKRDKD